MNKGKKIMIGLALLFFSILMVGSAYIYVTRSSAKRDTAYSRSDFLWGATVRPFATTQPNEELKIGDLKSQFGFVQDLFADRSVVRANIEEDTKANDALVAMKEKYNTKLYLILEQVKDFNQDIDYEAAARQFAQPIVEKYKGKVDYYQLSNELTGVVYQQPGEGGETLDAGYGLNMNKKRYENVRTYVLTMSEIIRETDPNAKIVITGHWVLIKPIQDLINDGVQADIIGWNWGPDMGEQAGVKDIDHYGKMDLPQIASDMGKKFWIVEANYTDGSANKSEVKQANYIRKLAKSSYDNPLIGAYMHYILTDSLDDGPAGQLGLVKIGKNKNGGYSFAAKKPAYYGLKSIAKN
jgi:hypothetical protein